ncbi:hypothetical protein EIN_074310 [Entamoeba invadens IP1]|uniref:Uncharacterized protein n=1 Tax=Entamoeba invadens IP1 TaxID=370355 RepID=A0A0A1UF54_ENTIV|nr:hypothetical protein EIN_074310 [Entamoeba invadens IP1]ELP92588.1 hypothetical protein EIN_074310 [Entamoeba invadens IP1]|eukprot:XP_004259359.1 hypothetical protein EIN_074310 [Entamoeba invadens IP1]
MNGFPTVIEIDITNTASEDFEVFITDEKLHIHFYGYVAFKERVTKMKFLAHPQEIVQSKRVDLKLKSTLSPTTILLPLFFEVVQNGLEGSLTRNELTISPSHRSTDTDHSGPLPKRQSVLLQYTKPSENIEKTTSKVETEDLKFLFYRDDLKPLTLGDGLTCEFLSLRQVIKNEFSFLKEMTSSHTFRTLVTYMSSSHDSQDSQGLHYIPTSPFLFLLKVEATVFGYFVNTNAINIKDGYHLDKTNFKVFSLLNHYKTKPFVFSLLYETTLVFDFTQTSSLFISIRDLCVIKKDNTISLFKEDINKILLSNFHLPFNYFSLENDFLAKPIMEYAFLKVE